MQLIEVDALIKDLQTCGCVTVYGRQFIDAVIHRINLHTTVDAVPIEEHRKLCHEFYMQGKMEGAFEATQGSDVVPVVHGQWVGTHDGWYYSYSCSECEAEALTKEETMHDQVCSAYCPHCGARMDGDANG